MSVSLGKYGKAIVAGLAALAYYLSDNVFDVNDGIQVALAVLGVLGVYGIRNTPDEPQPPPLPPYPNK